MPRKPRLHLPGGFYHVILRGNGRQSIFFNAADRAQWEDYLQQGLTRYGHRLHAYCWMTNHVHMAIQAGTDPLARFMAFLASNYARFVNRNTGRPGHLFERRYRAILVQEDAYLKELLRYIHLNPLRARMIENLADYAWSSHHAYLSENRTPWLTVDHLLPMFGANSRSARRCYSQFINTQQSPDMLKLLRKGAAEDGRIVGDDAWTKAVLDKLDPPGVQATLDELVQAACQRHNVTEVMLASRSRKRVYSNIRAEIALAATEHCIATVTEVARRFGRAHSGLSRSMNRLRDAVE
jgi:putative transposase